MNYHKFSVSHCKLKYQFSVLYSSCGGGAQKQLEHSAINLKNWAEINLHGRIFSWTGRKNSWWNSRNGSNKLQHKCKLVYLEKDPFIFSESHTNSEFFIFLVWMHWTSHFLNLEAGNGNDQIKASPGLERIEAWERSKYEETLEKICRSIRYWNTTSSRLIERRKLVGMNMSLKSIMESSRVCRGPLGLISSKMAAVNY